MQNNFGPPLPPSPRTQHTPQRANSSSLLAQFGVRSEHKMDLMNSPTMRTPTNAPAMRSTSNNSPYPVQISPRGPNVHSSGRRNEDRPDEEDEDGIEYAPRRSTRDRRSNTAAQSSSSNHSSRRSRKQVSTLLGDDLDLVDLTPVVSSRHAIRQEIVNKTVAHRDQFLVQQKDLWLPLLPAHNYISKLLAHHQRLSPAERANLPVVTPYKELEHQPKGVKAVMKPYQLSGLSFLLWLHHNGLSGILGDEMGLGKTLQTLSLIQYLKENDPKAGTGRLQRPFLIVCPLSVLSSWMAETKKWTPGLKAIRFHGPVAERQRLKKIVVGELDQYGRLTAQAKSKLKSRRNAAGKDVISLDTDSEDEQDVGVDLVVTTYDCFKAEQSWFKTAFVWRYVVLDEGHTVKNDASLISKSLQGIKAEFRLILTGTPLQNNLSELWALLHWLYPEVFGSNTNELFDKSFNLSKGQYSSEVLDNSRRLLELIMLRRMKTSAGVDLNLPPKTEVLLFVPLSEMQIFWYKRMITKAEQSLLDEIFKDVKVKEEQEIKAMKQIEAQESQLMKIEADALEVLENKALIGSDAWKETKAILEQTVRREQELSNNGDGRKSDWQKLMNLLMQLRKVCNHPYQLSNAEPDPYYTGDHVITASGKFIVLDKLVAELVVKQKKKILIFSGFTKMLDLVEEFLHLRGGDGTSFRSMRIDGQTARARRNLGIRLFNDLNSEYRVMLISTRAGGLGINLASASDVVLLDQDWNPQITLQAEARAHRIGQKNPVTIYKLISQGTVEEQMMGRIQKKLYLSAKVTEAMQDIHTKFGTGKSRKGDSAEDDSMPQLSTNQLMTLLRRGATAISRPEVDVHEMLSWDWETTVAKCKDNPADLAVKHDAVPDAKIDEEAERKWLSEMERVEATVFEGKKLQKSARYDTNKQASQEFFNKADRRIGKNTTVMVDGFAVSKESMNCAWGEAIPTLAGKDPHLAEPIRAKKAEVIPQDYCQVCIDGGDLHCCKLCPRSYHYGCLNKVYKSKAKGFSFSCPQHRCFVCDQSTAEAGGMLYRCRWCEVAYCEDCLDGDNAILIGNSLMEYELLGYPETAQAFYIQCGGCTDSFKENPDNKKLIDNLAEGIRLEYESRFTLGRETSTSTRPSSMTDATTLENTEVNTPVTMDEEFELTPASLKRKARVEIPSSSRSTKKGKVNGPR